MTNHDVVGVGVIVVVIVVVIIVVIVVVVLRVDGVDDAISRQQPEAHKVEHVEAIARMHMAFTRSSCTFTQNTTTFKTIAMHLFQKVVRY